MRMSRFVSLLAAVVAIAAAGCGSTQRAAPAAVTVDFAVTATPSTISLRSGGSSETVAVSVSAVNQFSGDVTVSVTGLPAGISAAPASLTLKPGTTQNVILSAAPGAAEGAATLTLAAISGTLAHSATLALSVQPLTGEFSLAVTPASLDLAQGATSSPLSIEATGTNGFAAPVAVSISGLPAGVTVNPSTLTLTPGTAQSMTLSATSSTATGAATVVFTGAAGTLSHAANLGLTVQTPAPPSPATPDVTTYHFDNARDGWNQQETVLTPANVTSATFGKLAFFNADGLVDAQPLYLSGLSVNGSATNALYMATEHDSLYALNADNGAQIWKASLLGAGEAPSGDHGCGQITPESGITATPVIDRAKGAIYAVAMSLDMAGKYHQRLHALSLTTGAELAGSPVEITGSYPGTATPSANGNVLFDPGQYAERAGLLLLNGKIYLTWTSHCDQDPYTGWVMAYDESTLQQTAILNLTPNGSEGSVWMSGNGMAADGSGNIYLLDANGTLDTGFDANGFPAQHDYGNAILKLSTANGSLTVADYFEPYNTVSESNADIDLGSGGAMLLPDVTDSTGRVRHLLVGAGKDQHIYVADRDNMGKINRTTMDNSNIYQDLPNALAKGAWSSPAYFNGTVYYGGQTDVLRAFPVTGGKLATTPSSVSSAVYGYPGTTPSVSSNGTQNGIVWGLRSAPGTVAILRAYDATNLANELYNSEQAANHRDRFGNGNKFITPVIVNGKVFVGTPTGVAEFGLLP